MTIRVADKILDYIKRNRVSTTEVADCLGKAHAVPNVHALNRGHFRVGPVRWVYAHDETNWYVHQQVADVQEGEVVLVESFDCQGRAIFGDLVSKFLILYRQAAAIVVQGNVRDVPCLLKENWPIWCEGVTPLGCFNRESAKQLDPHLISSRRTQLDGALAVCDDCGVVVIPKDHLNAEMLERLAFIERQEDIWYDCIDRRKMNTFETVCLKNYADEASRPGTSQAA
jgi:regulator of RNase E activity RraA